MHKLARIRESREPNITPLFPPAGPAVLCSAAPPVSIRVEDGTGKIVDQLAGPYQEGSLVTVVCLVEGGSPAPALTWWRDGRMLDSSYHQVSSLYFTGAVLNCTAPERVADQ